MGGAKKMLKAYDEAVAAGGRLYYPLDLFISVHSEKLLQGGVYLFETPKSLIEHFEKEPDPQLQAAAHRQAGIVTMSAKSFNAPLQDKETSIMEKTLANFGKLMKDGFPADLLEAVSIVERALKRARN